MNQLMLKSVKISRALHQTQPMPTEATLLRVLCSPSKRNVSSESLHSLGTNEASQKQPQTTSG